MEKVDFLDEIIKGVVVCQQAVLKYLSGNALAVRCLRPYSMRENSEVRAVCSKDLDNKLPECLVELFGILLRLLSRNDSLRSTQRGRSIDMPNCDYPL